MAEEQASYCQARDLTREPTIVQRFFPQIENNADISYMLLALMLLVFPTRRVVRSRNLPYLDRALSFDVHGTSVNIDTKTETRSISYHAYIIHFTVQLYFAASNRYSYEKNSSASLGTSRLADLSTRLLIKPSPKGSDLMW